MTYSVEFTREATVELEALTPKSYLFFCNQRTADHNSQGWTSPIYLQLIKCCTIADLIVRSQL